MLLRLSLSLLVYLMASPVWSAVILQYHHVSDTTPDSTSVSEKEFNAHLDWLEHNHFRFMSLPELVKLVKSGKLDSKEKIAAITFDDSYISICDTAWPILRKRSIPFTLFVSTSNLNTGSSIQCNWDRLKAIHKSGLMTIGNHAHEHEHMLQRLYGESDKQWEKRIIESIHVTQQIIDANIGRQPLLFAYPYGEFNDQLKNIVKRLGYTAFGQQSGAIGTFSDQLALPRFPLSGSHSNLKLLPEKMLSLPLHVELSESAQNPVKENGRDNPPTLTIHLKQKLESAIQCYQGNGSRIETERKGNSVSVKRVEKLPTGRNRYNCTAKSGESGRFFWISHQWLVD